MVADATIFAGTGNSTIAASHTSGPFTPTASGLIMVYGSSRRTTAASTGAISITNTGGLTFTKVAENEIVAGSTSTRFALFKAQAGGSPASMTVTLTSTNAERVASNVIEIATGYSFALSNFATATNTAGDPSVTLPNAPDAGSIVVAAAVFTPSDSTGITQPLAVELTDYSSNAIIGRNISFTNTSAPTSAAWTTGGGNSVGILVEVTSSDASLPFPSLRPDAMHYLVR